LSGGGVIGLAVGKIQLLSSSSGAVFKIKHENTKSTKLLLQGLLPAPLNLDKAESLGDKANQIINGSKSNHHQCGSYIAGRVDPNVNDERDNSAS
jgi:hypothetical protein